MATKWSLACGLSLAISASALVASDKECPHMMQQQVDKWVEVSVCLKLASETGAREGPEKATGFTVAYKNMTSTALELVTSTDPRNVVFLRIDGDNGSRLRRSHAPLCNPHDRCPHQEAIRRLDPGREIVETYRFRDFLTDKPQTDVRYQVRAEIDIFLVLEGETRLQAFRRTQESTSPNSLRFDFRNLHIELGAE